MNPVPQKALSTSGSLSDEIVPRFYDAVGQHGLVDHLSDCLGYSIGDKFHYSTYEAFNLISHAPEEWRVISPELQLCCLLTVYAMIGRSLSLELKKISLPPKYEQAFQLLDLLETRGWTRDSSRPLNCCIASYEADFTDCARKVVSGAYPQFFGSHAMEINEDMVRQLRAHLDRFRRLLGEDFIAAAENAIAIKLK